MRDKIVEVVAAIDPLDELERELGMPPSSSVPTRPRAPRKGSRMRFSLSQKVLQVFGTLSAAASAGILYRLDAAGFEDAPCRVRSGVFWISNLYAPRR
jgi:hypothetical protein